MRNVSSTQITGAVYRVARTPIASRRVGDMRGATIARAMSGVEGNAIPG